MVYASSILLADDEYSFRESTAELLRGDGYRCDAACDGHAALELLRAGSYDLVIADICMPGNLNLEFVEEIAKTAPGMPVVLVTGYPSTETAISSIHLPVAAYMTKPLPYEGLRRRLETILADSQPWRTLARVREQLRQCVEELDRLQQGGDPGTVRQRNARPRVPLVTLRALGGCVAELVAMEAAADPGRSMARTCELLECPRLPYQRNVLRGAVQLLNETKRRFKSKELAEVRGMLETLLKESL
ncbi:MAG: response regulator [Planctomycetaceae bacterium]|jgi:CheY-like chemotaxis protein|nr:response regulator [Planctomycetaceae bacterium]